MKAQFLTLSLLILLPSCNPAHPVPIDSPSPDKAAPIAIPTAKGTVALIKLQSPSGAFPGPDESYHLSSDVAETLGLYGSDAG